MILDDIKIYLDQCAPHVKQREAAKLLKRAQQEIEDLNKDKKRLDWIADRNNNFAALQLPKQAVENNLHDMRAAIDEAIRLTSI